MTSDAHPHHPLLSYPETGSQMGPNPTATEPHPESGRQGCPGESLCTQEMQYTPHIHSNTDTLCTHTHTQTLRPSTPPGARKQSHSSSETHRPGLMDAAQRSHTVGQGGIHKHIKRDAETETQRDTCMKGKPEAQMPKSHVNVIHTLLHQDPWKSCSDSSSWAIPLHWHPTTSIHPLPRA